MTRFAAAAARARLPRLGHEIPVFSLTLVGAAILATSMTIFFRSALLPAIGDSLSMSAGELGLIVTVFAVGRLLTDLPAGRVADRFAPTRILSVVGLGVAAGSLLFAVAERPLVLYIGVVILGVSSATANTTGMRFFSNIARPARRGTSMAVFSAALLGGQALGPALGGALSTLGSWRTAEAVGAGIGLAVTVGLLVAPARRRGARADVPDAPPDEPELAAVGELGRVERVVLHAVSFCSFFAMGSMPQTLVPLIGADAFDLSSPAIGLALGLGGICRFVGSMTGGVVSDRVSRKAAMVPGLAVMTAGVALLSLRISTGVWVAGIALLSLGSFSTAVAATMLADRTHASAVGRRFGSFRLAGDAGLMVGSVTAGFLYAHAGQTLAVLVVTAVLAAAMVTSSVVVPGGREW